MKKKLRLKLGMSLAIMSFFAPSVWASEELSTTSDIPSYYDVESIASTAESKGTAYFAWTTDANGNVVLSATDADNADFSVEYDSTRTQGISEDTTGNFVSSNASDYDSNPTIAGAVFLYDGALRSTAGTVLELSGNFVDNYAESGGAVYLWESDTSVNGVDVTTQFTIDADFIGNSAQYGGAIYVTQGTLKELSGDFVGNYSSSGGGAIYNKDTIGSIEGSFNGNYAYTADDWGFLYGGAIYNNGGSIDSIKASFTGNYVNSTYYGWGGAIYNASYFGTAEIGSITGDFIANSAEAYVALGGAIYNAGTIDSIAGDFDSNFTAGSAAEGGAIYNDAGTMSVEGSFTNNYAKSEYGLGGAVYVWDGTISFTANTQDVVNLGNWAGASEESALDENGGFLYMYGSTANFDIGEAYSMIIGDGTAGYDSIASYDSTSIINKTGDGKLTVNSSMEYFTGTLNVTAGTFELNNDFGGRISVSSGSSLILTNTSFSDNDYTGAGGAIYSLGTVTIGDDVSFTANKASTYGGAIYNTGTLTIGENSTFIDNSVSSNGGAIYNTGILTIGDGAVFTSNIASTYKAYYGGAIYNSSSSTLSLNDATFSYNNAYYGGAIYHAYGLLEITNSYFTGNYAAYTGSSITTKTGSTTSAASNSLSLDNVIFYDNAAGGAGGALGLYGIAVIENSTFDSNTAGYSQTHYYNGGGAIFAGGNVELSVYDSVFTNNSANVGGAITTTQVSQYSNAYVSVYNSSFDSNYAKYQGGAIYNTYNNTLVSDTVFTNNYAGEKGGAIYNLADHNSLASNSGVITIASTSGNNIVNLGNWAASLTYDADGELTTVPTAEDDANGGFLYMGETSTNGYYATAIFDTAANSSIIIGDGTAGYDSIASGDDTAIISKAGEGDLIVNSSMEYYTGALNIENGALILNESVLGASSIVIGYAEDGDDAVDSASLSLNSSSALNSITMGSEYFTGEATLNLSGDISALDIEVALSASSTNYINASDLNLSGTVSTSGDLSLNLSGDIYSTASTAFQVDSDVTVSGVVNATSESDFVFIESTTGDIALADGTEISATVVDSSGNFVEYATALTNQVGTTEGLNLYIDGTVTIYGDIVANSPININGVTEDVEGTLIVAGGTISTSDSGESYVEVGDDLNLVLTTDTDGNMANFGDNVSSVQGDGTISVATSASTLANATYVIASNDGIYDTLADYLTEENLADLGFELSSDDDGNTVLSTSEVSYFQDEVESSDSANANDLALAEVLDGISSTGDATQDSILASLKTEVASNGLSSYIMNNYSYIAEVDSMLLNNMNFANINRAREILARSNAIVIEDEDGAISIENEDGTISVLDAADASLLKSRNVAQLQSINLLGSKSSSNGVAGYNYWSVGSTANLDTILGDNALVGMSLGGTYNKVEGDAGDNANSTTFLLNIYGAYVNNNFEAFANLGYAHFWNEGSKAGSKADWDSDALNFAIGASYAINITSIEGLTLSPVALLNLVYLNSDSANYSNGTSIASQEYLSAKLMFGLEAEYAFTAQFNARLRAMYACELGDNSYDFSYGIAGEIGGISYFGGEQGRSSAILGLGLSYDFSETCSAYFDYTAYIYDTLATHSLNLSLGFKF